MRLSVTGRGGGGTLRLQARVRSEGRGLAALLLKVNISWFSDITLPLALGRRIRG